MLEGLEERCRTLMEQREYDQCEIAIVSAMATEPHSAIPHNLMGVLMERKQQHVQALKHFRAAYGLDPSYVPARYNLEQIEAERRCAINEADCVIKSNRW